MAIDSCRSQSGFLVNCYKYGHSESCGAAMYGTANFTMAPVTLIFVKYNFTTKQAHSSRIYWMATCHFFSISNYVRQCSPRTGDSTLLCPPYSLKVNFNIILWATFMFRSWSWTFRFRTKTRYAVFRALFCRCYNIWWALCRYVCPYNHFVTIQASSWNAVT